jgi:hypothetical protein
MVSFENPTVQTSVIPFPIAAWTRISALLHIVRSSVCLGRILLLIVSIELLTMPITQGLWTWDRFLHGGQDFELGLLIIVTCLCLVLLRVEQSRNDLGSLLAIGILLLNRRPRKLTALIHFWHSSAHRPRIPAHTSATFIDLPLLI